VFTEKERCSMPEGLIQPLTADRLHTAVAGNAVAGIAAAVRIITRLGPAGGDGDKVFPPTYKHPAKDSSTYAVEDRRIAGREVKAVLLDSAASQANRMEEAVLRAFERGVCNLPVLSVTIPRPGAAPTRVTVLDAPHRVSDAIFRDSELDGKPFRDSQIGKQLAQARMDNATALFQFCPTALIFGFWDSQSESGVHGAKVPRALTSEIVGLDVVPGRRTSSRVDPLAISASAAKVYKSQQGMWTLDEKEAVKEKNKPVLYGKATKAGKPSAVNHGNVTPSVSADDEPGGVTISEAIQTTVLSLPQLRRLRFPDAETGTSSPERDAAGRTVLAALALYAVALQREEGYFLRSRCHLIPLAAARSEFLGATVQEVGPFALTTEFARKTFEEACQRARECGLSWKGGLIELQPAGKLVELVRRSDDKVRAEGGDEDAST
jgi:CRISPR-associated protein Csb1